MFATRPRPQADTARALEEATAGLEALRAQAAALPDEIAQAARAGDVERLGALKLREATLPDLTHVAAAAVDRVRLADLRARREAAVHEQAGYARQAAAADVDVRSAQDALRAAQLKAGNARDQARDRQWRIDALDREIAALDGAGE